MNIMVYLFFLIYSSFYVASHGTSENETPTYEKGAKT